MKSLINTCLKSILAFIAAGSLAGCYEIGIWEASRSSGNLNTELSQFLNAKTDEEKAKGLQNIRQITQVYSMVQSGWDSVVGYMSMYINAEQREATLSSYDKTRDMLGLSLLLAGANLDTYCRAVANCTAEDYNALLLRGKFVKGSLELANPALHERVTLFKARYPKYNLETAQVERLRLLLVDDDAFLKFLTDDEEALKFIATEMEARNQTGSREDALRLLKPLDVTILPALGS